MNVLIAGANGMVGRAVDRALPEYDYHKFTPSRAELDLTDARAVDAYFKSKSIDAVIVTAGQVGGILANAKDPVGFFNTNMAIASNCINSAAKHGIKKLIYLGSSCIYPKEAPNPISEDCLLSGALEPTNQGYALAKIAGVKLCEFYRSQYGLDYTAVMPCNLYGAWDNYNLELSHVIPALIFKFHDAKIRDAYSAVVWGSGTSRREFLHVRDLADACEYILQSKTQHAIYNVGSGTDISIMELAFIIKEITAFKGWIDYDVSKPDGVARKLMDSSRIRSLGWTPKISLQEGLSMVYQNFLAELGNGQLRM